MGRRRAYLVLAVAAAVPRLAALLAERRDITDAFVDKGDDFALTFLDSGTYGFIPGIPSAYTQPLYGFFLIPLYWVLRPALARDRARAHRGGGRDGLARLRGRPARLDGGSASSRRC